MTAQRGLVLFAHGARDPEWALPFQRIAQLVRAQLADTSVQLAFLEFMQPALTTAVDQLAQQGTTQITIVPLFMAQGGHLKHDVPKLIDAARARHPRVTINMTSAIGDVELLVKHIADWVVATHTSDHKE